MTLFVDGDFNMVDRQKALIEKVRSSDYPDNIIGVLVDRIKYHAPAGVPYASTIGMPMYDDDGNYEGTCCVGCGWCEGGPLTQEEHEESIRLVKMMGLDDPTNYGVFK